MQYQYEFTKVRPKQLFVQIKFSAEGHPDLFKNIITDDFSEQALDAVAQQHGRWAVSQWEKIAAAPEEAQVTEGPKDAVFKPERTEPRPDFDPATQKLEPTRTETDTEIVNGWTVVDKTVEEQQQYLDAWRQQTQVSMRQTRLALIQQGLLNQVNAAIAAMDEPDKSIVETEWEYAHVVDRNSPWVIKMGDALGLTPEQLDDLFVLAATL